MKPPAFKPKKCAECKAVFIPSKPLQKVCSLDCAISIAKRKRQKIERANDKIKREDLKTRSDFIKEAQKVFNAYVRERDQYKPCICCGLPLTLDAVGGGFDCGHYRSIGSAPHLRFDERNAHGQRKQCNRYGAGRAVDYRIGLIQRIGLNAVEEIEKDQTQKHYSKEDLITIKKVYSLKLKHLKNGER